MAKFRITKELETFGTTILYRYYIQREKKFLFLFRYWSYVHHVDARGKDSGYPECFQTLEGAQGHLEELLKIHGRPKFEVVLTVDTSKK